MRPAEAGCAPAIRACDFAQLLFVAVLATLLVCASVSASTPQAAAHVEKGLQLAQAGDLQGAESELRKAVSLAPNDPESLTNLATVLAMEKKLDDSTTFFERALKIDPANLTSRRYLAANLWQLHRYPEAKENLEIILKQKSDDNQSRLLLGMVAEDMKDYASAARMLASVPAEVRKQPESIAALADSYYHLDEKDKARAWLRQLQNHPDGPRAALLGAQIADQNADYEVAEQLLSSTKGDYEDPADLSYRLAAIEYHAHEFEQSEQALLQLVDSGTKTGRIFNLLGWCYWKQGRTEQAMQAFENGIGAEPNDESNYLDLQKVLLAGNRVAAALEVAKKTTAALPNSARSLAMRGSIEMQASQFTNAVDSYRRAKELADSADAALGLADAEFSADVKREARADFAAGIKQFPGDARFPLHYAEALLKDANEGTPAAEAHAEALLKSAVKLDPSSVEARCQLGDLALNQGNTNTALQEFTTAAKLDPRNAKAHFGLARVYRRLGRREEASREAKLFQQLQDAQSNASGAQPSAVIPN